MEKTTGSSSKTINWKKGRPKGNEDKGRGMEKRIYSAQDAPPYLRFNPFITGGYRGPISPKQCVQR